MDEGLHERDRFPDCLARLIRWNPLALIRGLRLVEAASISWHDRLGRLIGWEGWQEKVRKPSIRSAAGAKKPHSLVPRAVFVTSHVCKYVLAANAHHIRKDYSIMSDKVTLEMHCCRHFRLIKCNRSEFPRGVHRRAIDLRDVTPNRPVQ